MPFTRQLLRWTSKRANEIPAATPALISTKKGRNCGPFFHFGLMGYLPKSALVFVTMAWAFKPYFSIN